MFDGRRRWQVGIVQAVLDKSSPAQDDQPDEIEIAHAPEPAEFEKEREHQEGRQIRPTRDIDTFVLE